ncbi:hypothetical protein IEQ34_020523 [Dendrobium chrysotoxum]|uniref:Uncharacterized protein n=1 Tax=Dendrobium chrysotoxum TaxID=161865 RepID=A0AAV7G0Q0_DENCH|nr:hypothetical protein IEQ34_020523 [Dendrobium chrysotoxum]
MWWSGGATTSGGGPAVVEEEQGGKSDLRSLSFLLRIRVSFQRGEGALFIDFWEWHGPSGLPVVSEPLPPLFDSSFPNIFFGMAMDFTLPLPLSSVVLFESLLLLLWPVFTPPLTNTMLFKDLMSSTVGTESMFSSVMTDLKLPLEPLPISVAPEQPLQVVPGRAALNCSKYRTCTTTQFISSKLVIPELKGEVKKSIERLLVRGGLLRKGLPRIIAKISLMAEGVQVVIHLPRSSWVLCELRVPAAHVSYPSSRRPHGSRRHLVSEPVGSSCFCFLYPVLREQLVKRAKIVRQSQWEQPDVVAPSPGSVSFVGLFVQRWLTASFGDFFPKEQSFIQPSLVCADNWRHHLFRGEQAGFCGFLIGRNNGAGAFVRDRTRNNITFSLLLCANFKTSTARIFSCRVPSAIFSKQLPPNIPSKIKNTEHMTLALEAVATVLLML